MFALKVTFFAKICNDGLLVQISFWMGWNNQHKRTAATVALRSENCWSGSVENKSSTCIKEMGLALRHSGAYIVIPQCLEKGWRGWAAGATRTQIVDPKICHRKIYAKDVEQDQN